MSLDILLLLMPYLVMTLALAAWIKEVENLDLYGWQALLWGLLWPILLAAILYIIAYDFLTTKKDNKGD